MLRGVYPEPLLPPCGIRAVRKWRANGLSMTVLFFNKLLKNPLRSKPASATQVNHTGVRSTGAPREEDSA